MSVKYRSQVKLHCVKYRMNTWLNDGGSGLMAPVNSKHFGQMDIPMKENSEYLKEVTTRYKRCPVVECIIRVCGSRGERIKVYSVVKITIFFF